MGNRFSLSIFCGIFCGTAIMAQTVDVQKLLYGVKIGAQLTESFNSVPGFNSDKTRLVIGPMVTYEFLTTPIGNFGVEVDLLFRRYRFDQLFLSDPTSPGNPATPFVATTTAHAIDLPLLATWSPFGARTFSPYVLAGLSLRRSNGNESRKFFLGEDRNQEIDEPTALRDKSNAGFTIGAGLQLGPLNRVHIAPEFRYTRWSGPAFQATSIPAGPTSTFRSQQNIAEFLVGLTF